MHSVTDRLTDGRTDGRHGDANSQRYYVAYYDRLKRVTFFLRHSIVCLSVCLSVRLSVCNAVQRGSQALCTYVSFSNKTRRKNESKKTNFDGFLELTQWRPQTMTMTATAHMSDDVFAQPFDVTNARFWESVAAQPVPIRRRGSAYRAAVQRH